MHTPKEQQEPGPRERYEAIFNNAAVGMVLVDPRGAILHANRSFCQFLGYNEDSLRGRTVEEISHPFDQKADSANAWKLAHGQIQSYTLEKRFFRKDGATVWGRLTTSLIRGQNGSLDSYLGLVENIDDRKRAESELEMFKHYPDQNPSPVMRLGREGRLLYANPAARDLLSASRKDGKSAIPASWMRMVQDALLGNQILRLVENHEQRTYALTFAPTQDLRSVQVFGQDITNSRRMESVLRGQRDLLESIIDTIPMLVSWKDRHSRYLGCNKCFSVAAGLQSTTDVIGLTDATLPWSDKAAALREVDMTLIESGLPQIDLEERMTGPVGGEQLLRTYKVPLWNDQGDVYGLLTVSADITQISRAEKQLRLLQAALERAANAIIVTDRQGSIVWINKAFTDLTGFGPEEALGGTPRILKSGLHYRRFYQDLWATVLSGKVWKGRISNRRKDGTIYVEEMTISPLTDESGVPTHFIAIKEDVTKREAAEESLRRAKSEVDALLKALPAALMTLDHSATLLHWNQYAQDLLGLDRTRDLKANLSKLPLSWGSDAILKGLGQCISTGRLVNVPGDVQAMDREGRIHFLGVTLTPYPGRIGVPRILLVATDMTESRLLQNQLMQAQKLESIGQLAAGIAHEINTPIQFVGDNIHFLKQAFEGLDQLIQVAELAASDREVSASECGRLSDFRRILGETDLSFLRGESVQALDQALEGIRRVAQIVRAMKEFSHPMADAMELIDLNRAIESTVTVARHEWKYVAELELDLEEDLPLVRCNAGEVNQVVLNVLVNAAHAVEDVVGMSGRKGLITVSTRQADEHAEIRIGDSGPGIPGEVAQKIFDPFFTTKPVGKGTGQGLAIAHHIIVEKHGGRITLEDSGGSGAQFCIRLPLQGKANGQATA